MPARSLRSRTPAPPAGRPPPRRRRVRGGPLGQRAARAQADLHGGQLEQLVDRAAGVSERGGGDGEREEPEHGEAIERRVHARPVHQREQMLRRHEQIIRDGVVAAGAAQAAGVPGVEDLQLGVGMAATRSAGRPALVPPSSSTQPANSHRECGMPLQKDQRPETRTPPSTATALPRGAHTPAAITWGSLKISAAPSSGR